MRRKKLWIALAVCLAIIVALSLKAYLFFNAKPNINVNYVAKWNALSKPANYDPCQNAYFDYTKAEQYIVQQPQELHNWPDWPGDMNEDQLKILRDWLSSNNEAIKYFKQGANKPYCWIERSENTSMLEVLLPNLSLLRSGSWVLCWRAKLNAFDNDFTESFEDIFACYRVGQQLNNSKGLLVEHLVGFAIRADAIGNARAVIANSKVDINSLAKLQIQMEDFTLTANTRFDLTPEKNGLYDIFQRVFSDDGHGNGHLIPAEITKLLDITSGAARIRTMNSSTGSRRNLFWENLGRSIERLFSKRKGPNVMKLATTGPDRKQYTEKLEQLYKLHDGLQDKTPWQIKKEGFDDSKLRQDLTNEYFIIASFFPALTRVFDTNWRTRLQESALITLCAILRYKAQYGQPPENLQELIDKGFMKQIPQDPYGNGPCVYKKIGDDFTLYSLGPNFTDEGGKIVRDDYGQILMWDEKGDTVFWPHPKETKEEKEKRLEEQNKLQPEVELLKRELELIKKRVENQK